LKVEVNNNVEQLPGCKPPLLLEVSHGML